uniref:Uncharacterized protein n=1 Tax=viral metagenome TaxID=1070528 RepID=A0A6C0ET78_9ZZZZ
MDQVHYKELKVGQKYIIEEEYETVTGYFIGEQSRFLGFYSENMKPFWTKKRTKIYKLKIKKTFLQKINTFVKMRLY